MNERTHIFTPPFTKFLSRSWLDFLYVMTQKEIKARYKHSILGFLWILLNPLLQMIVLGLVFQFFVPVNVGNYFIFLFTGLLPWNFFSLSLSKSTPSILYERSLIQKSFFPRESIPLSIVLSNLFHMSIAFAMLVSVLFVQKIFFSSIALSDLVLFSLRISLLIPTLTWLFLVTSGFCLLSSALNVRYRDVNFIIQALLIPWFYITPIIYTLDLLPQWILPFMYLNPLTSIIELLHWILLGLPLSNPDLLVISMILGLVIVKIGWMTFNKEKKWFDDWV